MNETTDPIEINGVQLSEGDTLWRLKALRTYKTTFSEQDPDEVIQETAEALVKHYPEKVNNAPVDVVAANLKGTPGIYDDTDLMNYHAMEVTNVETYREKTEVSIKDLKEQKTYVFTTHPPEEPGSYYTFEPLSVLEAHLGTTLLPVGGE